MSVVSKANPPDTAIIQDKFFHEKISLNCWMWQYFGPAQVLQE